MGRYRTLPSATPRSSRLPEHLVTGLSHLAAGTSTAPINKMKVGYRKAMRQGGQDFDDALHVRRAQLSTWFSDHALPLWGDAGYDAALGLFHERLDFAGRPLALLPRRLMVQCRQLYVFSHATLLGLRDDRALIEKTFERVVELFRQKRPSAAGRFRSTPTARSKMIDSIPTVSPSCCSRSPGCIACGRRAIFLTSPTKYYALFEVRSPLRAAA